MSNPTAEQMLEAVQEAYNQNDNAGLAGRVDAVLHIGLLQQGVVEASDVDNMHNEIADPNDESYDARYHYAYLQTWNALYDLVKGSPLKSVAKNHG